MPKLLKIVPSHLPEKKLDAVFQMESGRTKTVPFGARGMDDYTLTKDKEQRERYRARHKGDTLTNPLVVVCAVVCPHTRGRDTEFQKEVRCLNKFCGLSPIFEKFAKLYDQ